MSFAPHLAAPVAPPVWSGEGVAADTPVPTARGTVPAGNLVAGDSVLGAGGQMLTVAGLRRMKLEGPAFRRLGMRPPVLIGAGALGMGRPGRDLVLGPDQAVRLGGAAVPADLLVDGVAIRRIDEDADLVAPRFDRAAGWMAAGAALAPRARPGPREMVRALLGLPRAAGPLQGHVDHADRFGVVGWARDAALPQAVVPMEVMVLADGGAQMMAQAPADRPRPDLVRLGLAADGDMLARHGFSMRFAVPLPPGRAWLLLVRRAGGGAELPGCPLLVDGAGGSAEGFDTALAGLADDTAAMLAGLLDRAVAARLTRI